MVNGGVPRFRGCGVTRGHHPAASAYPRNLATYFLLVLAIAMTPAFGDTPDTRLSSAASIGQDVTPMSLTARPASTQNPLFTTPHLACDAVPVTHHAPIHSPRPELAFGGAASSFTHLHCLHGVFRI